jgi:predicted HicB family RNase H-like nuclease
MAQETLKQVNVRMSRSLHFAAIKMARREKISFGEFVRRAVDEKVDGIRKRKAALNAQADR